MLAFPLSSTIHTISPSATLSLNARVQELSTQGISVINLAIGELDAPSPNKVKAAGIQAIKSDKTRYTQITGIDDLKKAIAHYYKNTWKLSVPSHHMLVGNGGKHILSMLFGVLLEPGDEVIMGTPYWTSYPEQVKLHRGVPVLVKTDQNWIVRSHAIEKAITQKTKAIIVNSPSNPTGAIIPKNELEKILALAHAHRVFIISDEVYSELYFHGKPVSIASLEKKPLQQVIVASSVSKMSAMTGWRIGFAIGRKEIIEALEAYQSHSSGPASTVSQYAALKAFDKTSLSYTNTLRADLKEKRRLIIRDLSSLQGISISKPMGAFYLWCRVSDALMEKIHGGFCERLLESERVAVVPGVAFGREYTDYFRLSFAVSREALTEGIKRIKKFIENL